MFPCGLVVMILWVMLVDGGGMDDVEESCCLLAVAAS